MRELKKKYMEDGIGDKKIFLRLKSEAEEILDSDYARYEMDGETKNLLPLIDDTFIIKKRIENATFLHQALSKLNGVQLMFPSLKSTDIPLYVPILVANGKRNALKRYLIDNGVFCPNHWDNENFVPENNSIYEQELSLICDQRYDTKNMQHEIDVIKNFFKLND